MNYLFLLIILILGKLNFCTAQILTLHDAQKQLFDNNYLIQISEQKYLKSLIKTAEVKSSWYPKVELFTNYGYKTEKSHLTFNNNIILEQTFDGNKTKDTIGINVNKPINDNDAFETGINFLYPIFTGFSKLNLIKAQNSASKVQSYNVDEQKNFLSFILAKLYFKWEFAITSVKTNKILIKQMTEHLGQIKDLNKAGLEPLSKVLQASSKLENSKVEQLFAESLADSLRNEILSLINASANKYVVPQNYNIQTNFNPDSIFHDRVELEKINAIIAQINYTKKALFGGKLPTLFLNAEYKYANPGIDMGYNKIMAYGCIGLKLNWTIYDGMKNWSKRVELQHDINIMKLEKKNLIAKWNKKMSVANTQLKQALRLKRATELALSVAEKFAKDAENSMKAGVLTSSEYIDAISNVHVQKMRLANAELKRKLSILTLAYESGQTLLF